MDLGPRTGYATNGSNIPFLSSQQLDKESTKFSELFLSWRPSGYKMILLQLFSQSKVLRMFFETIFILQKNNNINNFNSLNDDF